MKKSIVILFLGLIFFCAKSQSIKSKWSDLFSYNNVLAFKEKDGTIIAASENGLFYYNTVTGEIKKLSKANGLHEVKISAFDFDPVNNVALIGYQSGNLDVVTESEVTYIVDIPLSQSYNGNKKINHISINGDLAVLSVGYGVSIFNLKRKEFGDTCFFSVGSSFESVNEAVIKNNTVYAATANGLKSHALNVTFSVYSSWDNFPGNYSQIASGEIITLASNNSIWFGTGSIFSPISASFSDIKDIKIDGSQVLVTDDTKVKVFNLSGALQNTINFGESLNTAGWVKGQYYAGTKSSGLLDAQKNSYKPDGPFANQSYKMTILGNQLWVSTGGRDAYDTPLYTNVGYYHFDGVKWNYPDYFKTSTIRWNILDVIPNPFKTTEVFFTNYSFLSGEKGIYRMEANDFVKAYEQDPLTPFNNRPIGCVFDNQGQFFCTVGILINQPFTNGVYIYNRQEDRFLINPFISAGSAQKPIHKNSALLIPSPYFSVGGLIIFEYNNTPFLFSDDNTNIINKSNGLPASGTVAIALDKNDDVWIGTRLGLRVVSGTSNLLNNNIKAEPIVITQKGIAEELFKDLHILQIEVDSGNQKWVSIDGGGVFYLSSDGEKTILQFNKTNSPLPNDTVTDIKVDPTTGKVYFCTFDGIVVYQGDVVNVGEGFSQVKVYPNPVVSSQFKGNVKITGLAEKTNIRITDAAGNVVHQAVARGGFYEWNLNNTRGQRVASGMYFVLMTNADGTDKATAKIAVIN